MMAIPFFNGNSLAGKKKIKAEYGSIHHATSLCLFLKVVSAMESFQDEDGKDDAY